MPQQRFWGTFYVLLSRLMVYCGRMVSSTRSTDTCLLLVRQYSVPPNGYSASYLLMNCCELMISPYSWTRFCYLHVPSQGLSHLVLRMVSLHWWSQPFSALCGVLVGGLSWMSKHVLETVQVVLRMFHSQNHRGRI